uniref:ABSCISIC ACID-INSENSITIVE 5-like protein 5 n=1 Tax=Anthurium amnicola TaxID=1678845 RepID=A0A1D1Z9H4_9ARAE
MNFKIMGSDGKDGRPPAFPSSGVNLPPMLPQAGLVRQSSIYSLTFDEFQSTLGGPGKDFGSMNMDEFLKNIWTVEEMQTMSSAAAIGASGEGVATGNGMAGLQRQGSLTLPRTISQKTVDEVWQDLFVEGGGSGQGPAGSGLQPQQRELTLGEMTLEDFLVRAGVVREDLTHSASRPIITSSNIGINGISNSNTSNVFYVDALTSNLNDNASLAFGRSPTTRSSEAVAPNPVPSIFSMISGARPPFVPPMQLDTTEVASQQGLRGGGPIMGIGDPAVNNGLMPGITSLGAGGVTVAVESPENHLPSDGLGRCNGDLASLSPSPYAFNGGLRGRKSGGTVEKVVERRQKRMIKNRESAARSRARKQAYITELEDEVADLKEQNEKLEKKQAAILKMQKNQALEITNQPCGSKKRCLRRTMTGPW